MTGKYKYWLLIFLVMFLSGCSLLQLPFHLIGGTFSLIGKLFAIADKLPKPPPGVFF